MMHGARVAAEKVTHGVDCRRRVSGRQRGQPAPGVPSALLAAAGPATAARRAGEEGRPPAALRERRGGCPGPARAAGGLAPAACSRAPAGRGQRSPPKGAGGRCSPPPLGAGAPRRPRRAPRGGPAFPPCPVEKAPATAAAGADLPPAAASSPAGTGCLPRGGALPGSRAPAHGHHSAAFSVPWCPRAAGARGRRIRGAGRAPPGLPRARPRRRLGSAASSSPGSAGGGEPRPGRPA